jgi:hypothetical protein
MATQNRKRSTDESATTKDAFALLFAEGDSQSTKFPKLKDAYTTVQDECEQQRQKRAVKEGVYKSFLREI